MIYIYRTRKREEEEGREFRGGVELRVVVVELRLVEVYVRLEIVW